MMEKQELRTRDFQDERKKCKNKDSVYFGRLKGKR